MRNTDLQICTNSVPKFRFVATSGGCLYNNIYFIEEGGWHFTNIRKPEDLEKKLSNFLHHIDFQESGLHLKDLKKLMDEKKIMYDHSSDKSKRKWGNGEKLQTIKLEEMPKYIIDNYNKYKPWLDLDNV